jgi:transcriptional regulator GlxA family with amidase domain
MKAVIRLVMSLLFLLGPAHAHDMHASGLRVAVVLFEGVEEIDYAGPIEVFGASGARVFTVGETRATVESVWGLKVTPDYDFSTLPEVDVLLVPGGGVIKAWKNQKLLDWIKERSAHVKVVMSVCSGAFILGKAGMLDGIPSTTTTVMRPQLAQHFPATKVTSQRFVDAGKIITTAGLSAGIDGALYVVSKQLGQQQAEAAAKYMEYDWSPSLNSR